MKCGCEMTVGVERQPDRAMAEQLLDDLWVCPCLKEDARHRMAEVVDPNVRKAGGLQGVRPSPVDLTRLDRSAVEVGKDETALYPVLSLSTPVGLAPPMAEQALPCYLRQVNGPPTLFRFWRCKEQPSTWVAEQCSADDQPSLSEVDVHPFETERFSESHPGRPEENPQCMPAGASRGAEQILELRTGQGGHLPRTRPRRWHQLRRIPADDAPVHRLLEGKMEHTVRLLNATGRQPGLQERRIA